MSTTFFHTDIIQNLQGLSPDSGAFNTEPIKFGILCQNYSGEKMKHLISANQYDRAALDVLFSKVKKIKQHPEYFRRVGRNKILTTLFYEPSTRTRLSFESAMLKMGGGVLSTENASEFSSIAKGESLSDTIRVVGAYCDVIALRHSQEGSSKIAVESSSVPIINAGDGSGEHPTQALLDLYTIQDRLGQIDGKHLVLIGDLKYGRTIHSLCNLLHNYHEIKLSLVSPPSFKLPGEIKLRLEEQGISVQELEDLPSVITTGDVFYQTRVQAERLPLETPTFIPYKITLETLQEMKENALLMHPLPRLEEIAPECDSDPRSVYFMQSDNGLYVRMAVLQDLLKR
jgi:aspartate carbamoyltransferase catalytic subunit